MSISRREKVYCRDCKWLGYSMNELWDYCGARTYIESTYKNPIVKGRLANKVNVNNDCTDYQRKWYLSLWDKLKLWGWVRGEEMSLLEGCEVVSHVKQ